MWIKRLFGTIWDLAVCFLSFFAGFLVLGVIGSITYGFIYPGVEQVPEPWSTRIVYFSLVSGLVLAAVVWIKRRRKRNKQAAVASTKQPELEPLPSIQNASIPDIHIPVPVIPRNHLIDDDRDAELRRIDFMEGHEFEHWCAALLRKTGFVDVIVTQGSGDQGVDVLAEKDGIRYAIQCKCYSKDLGNKPVQEVNSGKMMPEYHCQIGVVMTNRYFTKGAKDLAAATGTLLWDRDWIKAQLQTSNCSALSKDVSRSHSNEDLLEAIIDDFFLSGQVSISHIQRKFGLDYQYASFIVQTLEEHDFITPVVGTTPRKVKISYESWEALKQSRKISRP